MSFSMQKFRSLLPGQQSRSQADNSSESLEPEIGFQITIEASQQPAANSDQRGIAKQTELNVHLIAARHLPALFGFKIVHGYLIKVKLFPGTKRLDSSIQTNSWPKFNENFKFPLAPDIKSSLKHSSRRGSKTVSELFTPEELFAGQFVVFTVYALLELPPASFNRLNKTYRSLRDKSTNFVQKIVESSNGENKTKDEKDALALSNGNGNASTTTHEQQKSKRKSIDSQNPRDPMPPLTISESRRNIGSVTCYLEPKLFKRNARGAYATEELWLPIKDITTTAVKGLNNNNNLTNSAKGVVELVLEVKSLGENLTETDHDDNPMSDNETTTQSTQSCNSKLSIATTAATTNGSNNIKWSRMTAEMKRKMGISNNNNSKANNLLLHITTARMRCSNKVKDELESSAGSVYVKTTIFEHGIYIDAWKSSNFYPSLSTKWDVNEAATLTVPLQSLDNLDNILIRTTLATKTKMGKKLVLGTVLIGANSAGSGAEHMKSLREKPLNERVPMWHSYQ